MYYSLVYSFLFTSAFLWVHSKFTSTNDDTLQIVLKIKKSRTIQAILAKFYLMWSPLVSVIFLEASVWKIINTRPLKLYTILKGKIKKSRVTKIFIALDNNYILGITLENTINAQRFRKIAKTWCWVKWWYDNHFFMFNSIENAKEIGNCKSYVANIRIKKSRLTNETVKSRVKITGISVNKWKLNYKSFFRGAVQLIWVTVIYHSCKRLPIHRQFLSCFHESIRGFHCLLYGIL